MRRLPHAWRSPDCLQLGTSPGLATVIQGLTPHDRAWVANLAEGVDVDLTGPGDDRRRALVDLLHRAGLLEPAPTSEAPQFPAAWVAERLSAAPTALPLPADPDADARTWGLLRSADGFELLGRRGGRRVHVAGRGRLAEAITALLAISGVSATGPRTASVTADLVVLIDDGAADAAAAAPLVAADVAHLSVVVRDVDVVVGPLVVPGRTACLTCVDLHRADTDPAWPFVVRQLRERAAGIAGAESSLVAMAAGAAVGRVLTHLDALACGGGDDAAGLSVALTPAATSVRARHWDPHPECGCMWPPPDGLPTAAAPEDGARIHPEAGRIGA